MRIIPLSEGSFTIGKDKIFHPFRPGEHRLEDRSSGSLLVEVQPFCVVLRSDIILLDTGLGFSENGTLQIHQNLRSHGIAPEDVTKVLMTHLHKDHAGGVSFTDASGQSRLAFPNATYFVQRREYDFAEKTGYPSFITGEFEVFDRDPRVFWLHDDAGIIDGYIRYEVTGAHSPFHQVFWIDTPEGILFFGGDDAPQYKQMLSRFVAKYDHNGKKAMEYRSNWWAKGAEAGWTFVFYHDTSRPVVTGGS